jgi:hypothetical protein
MKKNVATSRRTAWEALIYSRHASEKFAGSGILTAPSSALAGQDVNHGWFT